MTAIDYDLEFLENGRTIEFISIGMVCDDGREYYAANSDMPVDLILNDQWLKRQVWPHLPLRGYKPAPQINALQQSDGLLDKSDIRVKPHWVIANEVREFIQAAGPDVELWANYGAYDHVCLAQLWGRMIDLPEGIPMFTHDIQQEAHRLGIERDGLPKQESSEHNALADAHHNRTVRRWLAEQKVRAS